MRTLIMNGRATAYQGEAYEVVLPGLDGEFSILDFHQACLYRLRKGIVKVKENTSEEEGKIFSIQDGLAKFNENSLLILCEMK